VTFPPEVVAAVARHMNDDHADDSVLICRALGGAPGTTAATMTGLDGDGLDFLATVDGVDRTVRVPFSRTLTERAEVRPEVVRLYQEACTVLGIEARPAASH
jgi:putative heme iron utilization protein